MTYLRSIRNLSDATTEAYRRDLLFFSRYLEETGLIDAEVDNRAARSFVSFLTRNGHSSSSINRSLSAVRGYFRFQNKVGSVSRNPFEGIVSLKKKRRLPDIFFENEIKEFLALPRGDDFIAVRDTLIFELLYSTGCRISELVGINLSDIHLKESMILVRGKGRKERFVFVGDEAIKALKIYLPFRKLRVRRGDTQSEMALVLNHHGDRMTRRGAGYVLSKYLQASNLQKHITPHTFRHSFATHILDHGADIRMVQEMLGHASLSTTQIYTHLGLERLKTVYKTAHPHANKKRGLT